RGDVGRPCEIDVPRQRADVKDVALDRDPPQFGDFADIDDEFRRDQTQVHRRHQALATRQQLGAVAVGGEQLQRVDDAGCAGVAESRGFHRYDLPGRIFGRISWD